MKYTRKCIRRTSVLYIAITILKFSFITILVFNLFLIVNYLNVPTLSNIKYAPEFTLKLTSVRIEDNFVFLRVK